jgi:membrane-bound lytic murein transglycosylase D
LRVGQTLTITVGGSAPEVATGSGSYVVRSGDTPSSIARTHGVDLDRLLGANGLSRRSTIYPGQTLVIP